MAADGEQRKIVNKEISIFLRDKWEQFQLLQETRFLMIGAFFYLYCAINPSDRHLYVLCNHANQISPRSIPWVFSIKTLASLFRHTAPLIDR
jgi:hypothetical protein